MYLFLKIVLNACLQSFKSFKTVVGEGGLVDPKVIENYRKVVLPSLLKGFDSRDVFNADETALFFKAMPNKTMYLKNMPANSIKVKKERLSILFCANMDGSEKMLPLVIGHARTPRCFK